MKPHKGRIEKWVRQETNIPARSVVWGHFHGHPDFPEGSFGHTSYIVSHDEATGEIETRNSRYTLGEPYNEA